MGVDGMNSTDIFDEYFDEKKPKYIVRNCPCFFEENEEVNDYTCAWGGTEELACQDCTDCLLKRIVERCKKVRECTADICTNPYEYATYCETRGVLQLLDIQECE